MLNSLLSIHHCNCPAGTSRRVSVDCNIYVLEGSGGNIAVFEGPDGKLMVDPSISVSQQKMTTALSGISNDPLKYLINTHCHFDNADGNEWVHNAGQLLLPMKTPAKTF